MELIRPLNITDAVLTSSSVVEAAPAAYAGGTTYALGATVGVATGTAVAVYTSLQAANTGNAPAASPLWWQLTGSTYATYSGAATYVLADIVIDPVTHRTYKSLQGANTGHSLTELNSLWWLDIGATNRWAAFDESLQSQSSNPGSIVNVFTLNDLADSVVLLNVSAATVRVVVHDATDGDVYDQTFSMDSDSGLVDFWDWCFEAPVRKSRLQVSGLPPYAVATLTVTATDTGANVLIGECVIGKSLEPGGTQFGARVGIQDFSIKQTDSFGNVTVLQRAFSDTGDFSVRVTNDSIDYLKDLLASYRAMPIVYIGTSLYGSTIVYGFFKDFSIVISYVTESICNIQVEGLT